jgi:hypothetical protein
MAKIKIEVEVQDHGTGNHDGIQTNVALEESSHYRDSVELYIYGSYGETESRVIHINKAELKKAVQLLCD